MQFVIERYKKILIGIVAGAFIVNLAYALYFRIHPVVDARAYDIIAQNLVAGNGFREDASIPLAFDQAIVRAGPGYEFFLAGLYRVFGHRLSVVWTVQALLHALSAYLIFLCCKRIFSDRGMTIGLVAAAIFAFSPDLIEIGAMVLTETLYLFLTVLVVYFFIRAYQAGGRLSEWFLLGLSLGVGILVRPPLALFVPFILFAGVERKQWRAVALCAAVMMLILLPWTLRNYAVYHRVVVTTMISDYNLWLGNIPGATGGQFSEATNPLVAFASVHGFAPLHAEAIRQFKLFVFGQPVAFMKLSALRVIRFGSLIRPMGFWFYQHGIGQIIVVVSSAIWIAVVFISGLFGSVREVWQGGRDRLRVYLVLLAITCPLPLFLTVVESRYRFPIYPFFVIFGAAALVQMWRARWWREYAFLISLAFLGLCTLADAVLNIVKIKEHISSF